MHKLERLPVQATMVWQVRMILGTFFPIFLLFFFYPPQHLLWRCCAILCAAAFFFFSLVWIPIKYWKLAYRVDGDTLYLRKGVIYTQYCGITRRQLQYVGVFSSPFERFLALCTVVFVLAGTRLTLPCVYAWQGEALCHWGNQQQKNEEEPI